MERLGGAWPLKLECPTEIFSVVAHRADPSLLQMFCNQRTENKKLLKKKLWKGLEIKHTPHRTRSGAETLQSDLTRSTCFECQSNSSVIESIYWRGKFVFQAISYDVISSAWKKINDLSSAYFFFYLRVCLHWMFSVFLQFLFICVCLSFRTACDYNNSYV